MQRKIAKVKARKKEEKQAPKDVKKRVRASGTSRKAARAQASMITKRKEAKARGLDLTDVRHSIDVQRTSPLFTKSPAAKRKLARQKFENEGIKIYGDTIEEWYEQITNLSEDKKIVAKEILSSLIENKKKVSEEAKDFDTELETAIEMCGMPHEKSKKKVKKEQVELSEDYKKHFRTMMKKHGVENFGKLESGEKKKFFKKVDASWKSVKEQDDAGDKIKDDELEKEPTGEEKEPAGNAMGEQMQAPRGGAFSKTTARQTGGPAVTKSRAPAGSAPDQAAKAAAFDKQREIWNTKAAAKAAAPTKEEVEIADEQLAAQVIPQQVQRQRRPVPAAAARPQAVMAIKKPLPPTPTRPVDVSARMRGQQRIRRPVPGYGAPRPVRTGRL